MKGFIALLVKLFWTYIMTVLAGIGWLGLDAILELWRMNGI